MSYIYIYDISRLRVKFLYFPKLYKFLELKPSKLKFHNIIVLKYYLLVAEWYNVVCATLRYLAKECVCVAAYTICK